MSSSRTTNSGSPEARIVADTASATSDGGVAVSSELLVNSEIVLVQKRTVHAGPLPDPATLRGLVDIYPDAAKIIFDDYHAQSAHRRDLERLRIVTGNTLALRSQIIGGALGAIGLVGSFLIAGFGHDWAASAIGSVSLVSLVSVFVVGRDRQRKERVEKAVVREKINQGEPVEEVDKGASPPKPPGQPAKSRKSKAT